MKRCPLCDFIYEDDQTLCDMDGIELVQERGALVPVRSAETPPQKKVRSVLPLVAAVFGAAVLSLYFLAADGSAPAKADQPPVTGQAAPKAAGPPATPPPVEAPASRVAGGETPAPPPPPPRPRAVRPNAKKLQSERGGGKKESKVGALLNKTGRILKKPFKF